jgi:hypothetical protein
VNLHFPFETNIYELWPKNLGSEIDNLIPNHKNPTKKDELTFDVSV